jgi:phosphoribosylformimino-5-aminoimidazole carboxamide ribotide isomerase
MTIFVACIDLHQGQVKQIVGGSLTSQSTLTTNYTSPHNAQHYSKLYKKHNLLGSHVIKLGPNNDKEAEEAIKEWSELQLGGGITLDNAATWLQKGAKQVIITSSLFKNACFQIDILKQFHGICGKDKLIVDLSCRKKLVGDKVEWVVAMDKWQTLTDLLLSEKVFHELDAFCSEFLVHAADVEGLCNGIDEELVIKLGEWCRIPVTYAGGARDLNDLELVKKLSKGRVNLTMGSCLDIFGGKVSFMDAVEWNKKQ